MNDFIKQQKAKILATYGITSIQKSQNDELEKGGKHGMIGEIRTWNGKRYKKQGNGKWLEVSRYGLTKEEHEDRGAKAAERSQSAAYDKHDNERRKLSDKEYDESELDKNSGKTFSNPNDLSELKEEIFEWLGSGQGNQIPTHKVKELVKDLSEKELEEIGNSVQQQISDTDPESWDRDTIDDLESIFNRRFKWEDPYENE